MRMIPVSAQEGSFTDEGIASEPILHAYLSGDEQQVVLVYPKNKPVKIQVLADWQHRDVENQEVTPEEMQKIRSLADFDLTMLVSEIHDNGWDAGRKTLAMMP